MKGFKCVLGFLTSGGFIRNEKSCLSRYVAAAQGRRVGARLHAALLSELPGAPTVLGRGQEGAATAMEEARRVLQASGRVTSAAPIRVVRKSRSDDDEEDVDFGFDVTRKTEEEGFSLRLTPPTNPATSRLEWLFLMQERTWKMAFVELALR